MPYELDFTLYKSGFDSPIDMAHANDDRLFIVERSGRIKIIDANGNTLSTPFLDIDGRVHNAGNQSEQGLLGLAFHPDYQSNGYFYVHYIANNDDSVIARFSVNGNNPNTANPNSELMLMIIDQPYTNHNGGSIKFGPDGYLYIGMGDGGSANDPGNRAQNTQSLHGKMLRIDVDNGNPYSIPSTNPFVNNSNTLDEIWAIGLRNPWKFSFDRQTGDMWIGDVGQGDWEEINYQPYFSTGGENYGWRCYEGNHPFNTNGCNGTYTPAVAEYNHQGFTHCSITGGYVYRGPVSGFANYGVYLYADYCSRRVQGTWYDGNFNINTADFGYLASNPTSFGEDAEGNMYVATLGTGQIFKIDISCAPSQSCPLSVVVVEKEDATCFGAFDGYAQVEVQDGNPPYNYEWPNGENTPALGNLGAFNYVVTVTDASNNTGTASITIEQPNEIEIDVLERIDITCHTLGGVYISVDGDFPPFDIDWSNGVSSTDNLDLTEPGTYSVTVTDNNNCTETLNVEILETLDSPSYDMTSSNDLTCANSCTTLSANLDGDNQFHSFEWDFNGMTLNEDGPTITVCEVGTYTLVVTSFSTGCSSAQTLEVLEDMSEVDLIDLTQSTVLTCNNPQVTLSVVGDNPNTTYQWSNMNNVISTESELVVTVAGNYTVQATDPNTGCTTSLDFNVEIDVNVPSVVAMAEGVLTCTNTTVVISAFSTTEVPLSFQWSTINGNIISGANEGVAEVDQAGAYTLVVTNIENGCTVETTVFVDEDTSIPQVSINATTSTLTCDQTEIVANGTSPSTDLVFAWSDMQGNIISNDISLTITQPGTYTLTVTDVNNGCESSDSITIDQAETPDLSLDGSNFMLTCSNSSISVTALTSSTSQNLLFEWTGPGGFSTQGMTTTITEEGNYTVTLTDTETACSSQTTFEVISSNGAPEFELVSTGELNCIFSEVIISTDPAPTFTLIWTGPSGFTSNQGTITISQAGTYCAEGINDLTGCSTIKCIEVIEDIFPMLPDVKFIIPGPVNCNGDLVAVNFGALYDEALEGIPHTYQWSTTNGNIVSGQTSSEINIDEPGDYCVVVTIPGNGCSSQSCITIAGAESPSLELIPTAPLCFGGASSGITSGVNAGMPPYSYLWSTGATTQDLFGVTSGSYSLTVIDANACTVEQSVTIIEPTPITINLETNPETSAGADNGSIVATVMGGTPSYSYLWSNGETTAGIFGLAPGNYDLTVTDANGCIFIYQATVATFSCALAFEFVTTDATCFGDANGAIDLIIDVGMAPFDFSWSNNATTEDISGLPAGTYSVTVIDADNCEMVSTTTVGEPSKLTASIEVDGFIGCLNEMVGLTCIVQGGTSPYTFTWSNGATSPTTATNGPGTFTCLVEDANGCSLEVSVTVTSEVSYPLGVEFLPDTLVCDYEAGDIFGAEYDLGDAFTYQWLSPNGTIENNILLVWEDDFECGDYTFSITSVGTGCSSKITYHFACPNIWYEIADVPEQVVLGCGNSSALIDLEIFPIEFETFEWKDPAGNVISIEQDIEVKECGIYTFTIFSIDYRCPAVFEVEVICDFEEPVADAGDDQLLDCNQSGVKIGGQDSTEGPEISYKWTDSEGNLFGDEAIIEVNECGIFILTVTDLNNGCTSSDEVEISCDQELPVADAGPDKTIGCTMEPVEIGATNTSTGNDFSQFWTDPNGLLIPNADLIYTPTECGVYTLIVVSIANGCSATDEVEVLCDEDLPVAVAGTGKIIDCDSIFLVGTGSSEGDAFEYAWTNEAGDIISTELNTSIVADGTGTGSYTLTVTNTLNGCSNAASVFAQDPVFEVELTIMVFCTDVSLQGPDIYDYTWSNSQTTSTANYIFGSSYSVTIADPSTGCDLVLSGDLLEGSMPPIAIAQLSDLIMDCKNTYLSGVGSSDGDEYEYEWTDANGNVVSTELSPIVEGFGEFTLTVTDTSTGCQTSTSVISPDITISSTAVIVDAADINIGSIDITVSGGTAPYTFEWSNGEITEDIDELDSGEYTVTITDANGCEHVSTFVVEFLSAISIINESSPVKIYPNPSVGYINLDFEIEGFNMVIVNLYGKEVYKKNNLTISESLYLDLHTGVYFIKLKQKDHGQYIAKLILHKK